jgi:RNA polymerase sigma factor (sigma-70 family)
VEPVQRSWVWRRLRNVTEAEETARPGVEEVYQEHRVALLRLAFLLTGSREHSEDLVQNAFASSYGRWDRIEQPLPYLKRAVVNQAADWQRRAARERGHASPEPTTHIPEVDETWEQLQHLPTAQRTVIVLHFYEDLRLAEIAQLLSRPPATVRSDLKRALDRLRKVLTQ